jgi:excisionase family DNA binding protein
VPSSTTLAELEALPALVAQLLKRVARLESERVPPDELLDAREAARLLSMTPSALRAAARRGSIPTVRIGRRLRFRRSALLR